MDLRRFKELRGRFVKAEKFYSDPDQPQAKKEAWRPELNKLVDDLAAEYQRLFADGKVTPADLPECTPEYAKMMFNCTEVEA